MITVALVDDLFLFVAGLAKVIDEFEGYKVTHRAGNGLELIEVIKKIGPPDIAILDYAMPEMDGYDTAVWLRDNHPKTRVLILTMYDSELLLLRLLRAGVKGFMKKDIHPLELQIALRRVMEKDQFYGSGEANEQMTSRKRHDGKETGAPEPKLSEQEITFVKLACSELTYKAIAQTMRLNIREVESLRQVVFEKLDIKSRVSLAIYAMRQALVEL